MIWWYLCFLPQGTQYVLFPQQRKLMGSSAQISSGAPVRVAGAGSGRFRRVPPGSCGGRFRAGAGSGGRFQKVPEGFAEGCGVCWCRFRKQIPDGSERFWRVLVQVPAEGSGKFLWALVQVHHAQNFCENLKRAPMKKSTFLSRKVVQIEPKRFRTKRNQTYPKMRKGLLKGSRRDEMPEMTRAMFDNVLLLYLFKVLFGPFGRARRRFWRVLLAYEQNYAPMCTFEIEKGTAHDTAMYAFLLLGIPRKLICFVGPCHLWSLARKVQGITSMFWAATGSLTSVKPTSWMCWSHPSWGMASTFEISSSMFKCCMKFSLNSWTLTGNGATAWWPTF